LAKSSERSFAKTDRLAQEASGKQLENILKKGSQFRTNFDYLTS
jgi:hypothetical protein